MREIERKILRRFSLSYLFSQDLFFKHHIVFIYKLRTIFAVENRMADFSLFIDENSTVYILKYLL